MKKSVFSLAFIATLLLVSANSQAQSLKDLFNKENVEKVVSAVTGKNTVDMTGTWSYTGAAIEFESDNLLMKAGGAVAATTAEAKLNEQLSKVGIKPGQMSFTFNADSTFNAKLGTKTLNGTYMYNATEKHVTMKFVRLINMNCNDLLSDREKEILQLINKGKMSKDIAQTLSISINTVNRHRQNILEKLQVNNSIEACRIAKELHLL